MFFKKTDKLIHKILHIIEFIIAILTLIVMVGLMGLEIYKMVTVSGYFDNASTFLHHVLTIVVGLEFVRMLIHLTPANTLEVLIVAISRQVIIDHDNAVSNIVCVLCIAGLFAIKRFLIPREDLKEEISGEEE
nr:hypothetical protein [Oscillospiraceae bacterium]